MIKQQVLLIALSCSLVWTLASSQQAQVVPAANDLLNGVDTVRQATQPNQRGLMPVVDVNKENNESKVDVHVPIFFDMTNLNNPEKSKLDLSVLQGLVTVQKDKARDQDGQMNGPMKVTVFGIPVYTSKGTSRSAAPEALDEQVREKSKRLENTIQQNRNELNRRAEELSRKVTEQVQLANNNLMSSLSNFLGRMNSMLKQNNSGAMQALNDISKQPTQQDFNEKPSRATESLNDIDRSLPSSAIADQLKRQSSNVETKAKDDASRIEHETFVYV